ncbi:hypothetical protein ACFLZH_02100 [Patescibacteria group bacterium]
MKNSMFNENRLVYLKKGPREGFRGAESNEAKTRQMALDFKVTLKNIDKRGSFFKLTNPKRQENVLRAWLALPKKKGGKEMKGAKAKQVASDIRKWMDKKKTKKHAPKKMQG